MIIKNSFYNLLGLGLPLVVAVFSIPILIQSLGTSKFGLLTLIWAVVSYFSLFDFGFGRALTQKLAILLGRRSDNNFSPLISTSIYCLIFLGVFAGIILSLFIPLFISLAKDIDNSSIIYSTLAMSFAMPAVILTAGYRGVLEATENFKIINAIRIPMGVFTFLGPLLAISIFGPSITAIAWFLAIGRYITLLIHIHFSNKKLNFYLSFSEFDIDIMKDLVKSGGWMSVSNVVSPLMSYIDRFIIGAMLSTSATAYYVTPQEILTKLAIFPTALTSVLFPSLAKNIDDNVEQKKLYNLSLVVISIVVAPIIFVLILYSHEILTLWINSKFADNSYVVLQILALGMFFTCIAQVPYTSIQGNGYAKYTAKLHLLELPFYILLVMYLSTILGVEGVAIAWTFRNIIDAIFLFIIDKKMKND